MSIAQFSHLEQTEKSLVYLSPALVTYLIGGVDKNFDSNEEAEAKHIVHFRTSTGDPLLFDFFKEVEPQFITQLDELVKQYGNLQADVRTKILAEELAKLNDIFPKLDSVYARALLKSLRSLAMAVAKSSGGILGFLEGTYEEKHLAELSMITYQP